MEKQVKKGHPARSGKRWLALLMSLCLIGTMVPIPARAENANTATGLCEHHTEHTAECGYEAPVEGHACVHDHTEDCYTQGDCQHEHTADCYSENGEGEADQCSHVCTAESGCLVLDCRHENGEHDDTCGYAEASEGSPCTYACEICGNEAEPEENNLSDAILAVQALIDALPDAEDITEENFEEVADLLGEIDTAREALTDEENEEIDYTKYDAAVAKMMELMGQPGAEETATMTLEGFSSTGKGDATVETICLDPKALRPESTWSTGGNQVYFGSYNGKQLSYRVLASPNTQNVTGTESLLLDCNTSLAKKSFDGDGIKNNGQTTNPNEWKGSDLETWLNDSHFYGNSSVFSYIERAAIASTELMLKHTYAIISTNYNDKAATNHIFCLSVAEAEGLYYNSEARKKNNNNNVPWWLRSSDDENYNYAGAVASDGSIASGLVNDVYYHLSPAMNVDLSKVLFASPARDIKPYASTGTLMEVGAYNNNRDWKLTLKDSSRSTFTASRTDGTGGVNAGETVSITYSGAKTGVDEYISVMLADTNNKILYYGHIASNSESSTGTVTIPSTLASGTYTLKVYSEQCNENYKTDYASDFININIEVTAAVGPQTLAAPESLAWDNTTPGKAKWDSVANASGYTVTLCKDDTVVKTASPSDTEYDFTSDITTEGSYTFKVKATGDGSSYTDSTEAVSAAQTFYSVSFNTNGGGTIDSQLVVSGGTVAQPADPTRDGYKFDSWHDSNALNNIWVFTRPVTANTTLYAKWLSKDAGISAVSVSGTAGQISGTTINVVLPFGSTIPTDTNAVSITKATGAEISPLSTNDNGATWTFTVTAEDDETIKNYTINVSVAASPLAGNQADVDAAKSAIESHNWTVAQGTANTSNSVKTWIEQQLGTMNLNRVAYTVNMLGDFTAAIAGTADDTDGTNGSFSFTVFFSKGEDTGNVETSTYANATTSVTNGAITATVYNNGEGSGSGGNTGDGSSTGGTTSEVTTSKDAASNTATTTSPTEVKVENKTASATVKAVNMIEAIRQAANNKSAEIVFIVSEAESGNADTIRLTISKADAQQILDQTAADLVVTTSAGDVILSQDTMGEVLQAAEGTELTIEVTKVTNPTEVQKQAAGDNGYIAGVTIVSQNKAITTFGGKTLTIRLEIPAALLNKEVAAIHIADDGTTEKMPGKVVTEGTKKYYEFTTTHLSTFALIEETPTVTAPKKGTLLTDSRTKMVYKVTKSGTTGGTVQFVKTKNTKAKTVAIPDKVTIDGITYKVTSIAANALKNNKTVTTVTIGKYVTTIGSGAFSGCTKLKKITIGKSVTTIGSKAFYKCTSLTSITIPSKVKKIGNYAFKGCTKLKTINLNTTLLTSETVSQYAFSGVSTSAVVKVPKNKNKTYKKLLVKKGLSKKVTIKNL